MSAFFRASPEQQRAVELFKQMFEMAKRQYHPVFLLGKQLRTTELGEAETADRLATAETLVEAGERFLVAVNKSLPPGQRYRQCGYCEYLYCAAHLQGENS